MGATAFFTKPVPFEEIRTALTESGIYTMNIIDDGDLEFVRAAATTLRAVFPHVSVFAPPAYLDGRQGGNFVLTASGRPLDIAATTAAIRLRGGAERGIEGEDLAAFIGDAPVLTDDYAPVDQMLGSRQR